MHRVAISLSLAALALAGCKDEPFDTARLKGSELLQKNDFKGAAVEYEKSLELKPDQDPKVWDRAAFANMKAGDYDKAAQILEKSLERRPDQAAKLECLRNIAGMYLQQANDLDKAEQYFQKAADLDPKDDQALSWLAEISSKRGGARSQQAPADGTHLQKAIERYDAVIAVIPDKPDAYINKRIVLVKYIDHLTKQKLSILADAEAQKKDKEAYDSAMEQAADTEKRVAELKTLLEATTRKLGEVNKALKK